MKTFEFHIESAGDSAAGIPPFSNNVSIQIEYGPMNESEATDLENMLMAAFAEFYDAEVMTKADYEKSIQEQNKWYDHLAEIEAAEQDLELQRTENGYDH